MKNDDVELIQRILAGDDAAFANLIRKYQQQIHAYALRRIGDFHISEDITQETFLRVHQNLKTLNDPTQFTKWLYAIVNNLCIAWHRKNRQQAQALAEIHVSETKTEAYSQYVVAEHAKTTAEAQRTLVEQLLPKLKESDQEVIALHYFEEMTSSEIGDHLGVSENTIKSRLHRARQRLKKYEVMIQEALGTTTEAEHRSQNPLKGETIMANEKKRTVDLEEMQRQIADLQEQLRVIADESDAFLNAEKKEAMSTLCRLPHNAERPITWGYGGGYRARAGKMRKRISLWTTSIDDFISRTPDATIANFASLFTNPTVVGVLRQLMEDKRSVADLAKGCDVSEGEIEKAVETLIDAKLAVRTEDNLIEPQHDAVFYFLNFVGMTRVHLNPKDH